MSDGAIDLFESGACLINLAEKSEVLMPQDSPARTETIQWVIAALNSMEMVSSRGGSWKSRARRRTV
ncbi:MAG: hypothetical protein AAGH17_02860 [Pseudomonadota bacterium]